MTLLNWLPYASKRAQPALSQDVQIGRVLGPGECLLFLNLLESSKFLTQERLDLIIPRQTSFGSP